MTQKILLALALTLATATVAVPNASACGGYTRVSPAERAVTDIVVAFAQRRLAAEPGVYVYSVSIDGERATAQLSLRTHRGAHRTREVTLRLREGGWRVVAVRPVAV